MLTVLYKEHSADAFRYALHLTGRRADAEDVVQQVFLQAHRHLEAGRELVNPRAWLLTAVKHRAYNLARDRREVPVNEPVLPVDAPDAAGDEAAQLAEVRAMLWTLPEIQHQAFVLRHWSGLSQKEIADVLETTPTAVESLLVRARSTLLKAHAAAADGCSTVRHRLLDSAELGSAERAHLGTCRPCRQAHTRLARAANLAGTLALVPGTHIADAIAGFVPGFSAHAATSTAAAVGATGGAGTGAGAGASGVTASWGTTTAITTAGKVAVIAKTAVAVAAATVAVGAIPPAHHALSALLPGRAIASRSGPADVRHSNGQTAGSGQGSQPAAPAVPGSSTPLGGPNGGTGQPPPENPGNHGGSGKGLGKPSGAGSGGMPAGVGGGQPDGKGNGKPLGVGGGSAGGNGNGGGKPTDAGGGGGSAGGNGGGKPADAGDGSEDTGGTGNSGGVPAGAGAGKPAGAGAGMPS